MQLRANSLIKINETVIIYTSKEASKIDLFSTLSPNDAPDEPTPVSRHVMQYCIVTDMVLSVFRDENDVSNL